MVLAELVNYAGEDMPFYLWGKLAQAGETAWDVGRRRAARESGSFSYRNAVVVEHEGQCAGCLIGYEIPDDPSPIGTDMPAMFLPLQQLENMARAHPERLGGYAGGFSKRPSLRISKGGPLLGVELSRAVTAGRDGGSSALEPQRTPLSVVQQELSPFGMVPPRRRWSGSSCSSPLGSAIPWPAVLISSAAHHLGFLDWIAAPANLASGYVATSNSGAAT